MIVDDRDPDFKELTQAAPRIDLSPPDIAAYRRGNTGVDFVTSFDSGRPGPHVVINALTHGNELCGAIAVDFLFRLGVQPRRGRLTLSFANVAAYQSFDPAHPSQARFLEEDLNRVWSRDVLEGPRDSVELRRARQLRPIFDRADAVLDLHSMQNATDPLVLSGRTARARDLAWALGHPAWIVSDSGHAAGRRLIDYAPFADPSGSRTALLVECGQHWGEPAAAVAIEVALRFLLQAGMVDPALAAAHLPLRQPGSRRLVDVTEAVIAEHDGGTFIGDYVGLETIPRRGTPIAFDGDRVVCTPYDDCVLIMPVRRLKRGYTAVRLGRIIETRPPVLLPDPEGGAFR